MCGDKVLWWYDLSTGALIISGTGEMADFYSNQASWISTVGYYQIEKAAIENGVTTIGEGAFENGSALTSIIIKYN